MRSYLTSHEINWSFSLSDEQLEALPLVSAHHEPQVAPQEYECGCVTVTRITDRDRRRGERPFEMRLAVACEGDACEVVASSPWLPLLEGVDLEIVGRSSRPLGRRGREHEDSSAPESRSRGRGDVASPPARGGA